MKHLIAGMICLLLTACATQVSTTNQLCPGMPHEQVKAILGDPSQTQFIADKWVWRYSLHEPWKGFVPHYLIFSKGNPTLDSWYADQDEYYRQQELWLPARGPGLPNIPARLADSPHHAWRLPTLPGTAPSLVTEGAGRESAKVPGEAWQRVS
jgi:hypothetical protein